MRDRLYRGGKGQVVCSIGIHGIHVARCQVSAIDIKGGMELIGPAAALVGDGYPVDGGAPYGRFFRRPGDVLDNEVGRKRGEDYLFRVVGLIDLLVIIVIVGYRSDVPRAGLRLPGEGLGNGSAGGYRLDIRMAGVNVPDIISKS